MPLCKAEGYIWRDPIIEPGHVQTLMVIRSTKENAAKMIQTVSTDRAGATFETGVYQVIETDGYSEQKYCLSSQVGCARQCSFCESGKPYVYNQGRPAQRLYHSLTAQEIVEQAENALKLFPPYDHRRLTFAFMGMGEPFDNIDPIKDAINRLSDLEPQAKFTISTIGHKLGHSQKGEYGIKDLADDIENGLFKQPVRLHISLHGSEDRQRRQIVPYAPPLEEVLDAASYFSEHTKSTVKLNYILYAGINSSDEDAHRIGRSLQNRPGLILKLSTLNASEGVVDKTAADHFEAIVKQYGVEVYRFTSLGGDIVGRCGEFGKKQVQPTVLLRITDAQGRVLLVRRSHEPYKGEWSLVTGKFEMEDEDDPCIAADRELRQETGLGLTGEGSGNINTINYSGPYIYSTQPTNIGSSHHNHLVHAFDISLSNTPKILLNPENDAYAWVNPNELHQYSLAEPLLDGELEIFSKN